VIFWLDGYPDRLDHADPGGLVGFGGEIEPRTVLDAYRVGAFPWSSDPVATWWSPDPRPVFEIATYRPHRRLRRRMAHAGWRFTLDRDFGAVMRACAEPTPEREETWITPDFIAAYGALHRDGHAHSVEVWEGEALVGGIYGLAIGGYFCGESMFHRRPDASKAALAHLVERLRAGGFVLFDAQYPSGHLIRIGATLLRRPAFLARLRAALAVEARLAPDPAPALGR